MVITPLQIDLWRRAPSESQILEYKEAKSGFDREKLAQYIVAKPPNIFPADATTILGAITGATLAAAEGTFGFLHLRRALSLAPRFGRSTADTPEVCYPTQRPSGPRYPGPPPGAHGPVRSDRRRHSGDIGRGTCGRNRQVCGLPTPAGHSCGSISRLRIRESRGLLLLPSLQRRMLREQQRPACGIWPSALRRP